MSSSNRLEEGHGGEILEDGGDVQEDGDNDNTAREQQLSSELFLPVFDERRRTAYCLSGSMGVLVQQQLRRSPMLNKDDAHDLRTAREYNNSDLLVPVLDEPRMFASRLSGSMGVLVQQQQRRSSMPNNSTPHLNLEAGVMRRRASFPPKSNDAEENQAVESSTAEGNTSQSSAAAAAHRKLQEQRRIERMSLILSESYNLLDSRTQERQKDSDSRIVERRTENDLDHHEPEDDGPAESIDYNYYYNHNNHGNSPRNKLVAVYQQPQPFIKSLTKSMHLVEKSQKWWANHRDAFHLQPPSRVLLLTVLHLAAYSILGHLLRVFIGQLFGGAGCSSTSDEYTDDDAPQWLSNMREQANMCFASNAGGPVFADLPANLVGSFLMGLWQASGDLGLTHSVPMAVWSANHYFQTWTLHHLGLRTGFCGSLTTLASWNSQMIRLMDGSHVLGGNGDGDDGSQFFTAFLGYLLGLQGALTCFRWGQDVAIWKYRAAHPPWAKEEDLLAFAYSKEYPDDDDGDGERAKLTMTPLTDYERRYLTGLGLQQEQHVANQNMSALGDLEQWKISTDKHRLRKDNNDDENENVLRILHGIERLVLVEENFTMPDEWRVVANENGWDLAALQRFARNAYHGQSSGPPIEKKELTAWQLFVQRLIACFPFALSLSLIVAFVALDCLNVNRWHYRRIWTSALLAPIGTVVRWKLSSWNGRLHGTSWAWFPLGTFTANLMACLASSALTAVQDSRSLRPGEAVLVYAFKTGLAGCLSTVSSFVAEGTVLQKLYPHHAKGYHYLFGTLVFASVFSLIVYISIVRTTS